MELTAEEQAEYERQRRELQHPRYHDSGKCGLPLIKQKIVKNKDATLDRQYCQTHMIYVAMTGWEIGWYGGEESKSLNKNNALRSIQGSPKNRE